jgi:hypothetical protein
MSDIGLNISVLDIFVYGVIVALPLTTILLVILVVARLGIGHTATRRGLHWALNAGIIAVGPFWAIGAGLTGWLWINGVTEEMRSASRHFTLTADRRIDGVDLPAGAEVTLDDYDRLESAALPSGIAGALDGSTWRGFIKFGHGQVTDLSAPTRISVGDRVTDTAFDGVLCRAGQPVAFWGFGGVRSCTLAKDTPAQDDIADAERGTVTVRFVCASDRRLEFRPGAGKEVASCSLAAPVEVQHVPCAAGSEIEIVNARPISCTLSAVLNFNGLEIPAGSVLHLVDSPQRIERFALPAIAPPLPAFGMELPAQSEVWLCRDRWAVDQVIVPSNAYVEIGGVKLTGTLNFDCGVFSFGTLFADTRIRGETWTNGRTVFRDDLHLPPSDRP